MGSWDMAEMAWRGYAADMGEDAMAWSESETMEWAMAEIAAAEEMGSWDGISAEMIAWAMGIGGMGDVRDAMAEEMGE